MTGAARTFTPKEAAAAIGCARKTCVNHLADRWLRPQGAPADELLLWEAVMLAAATRFGLRGDRRRRLLLAMRTMPLPQGRFTVVLLPNGAPEVVVGDRIAMRADIGGVPKLFDPMPVIARLEATERQLDLF